MPDGEEPPKLEDVLGEVADQTRRFAVSRGLQKADAEDVSQDVTFNLFHKKGDDPRFLDYQGVAAPLGTTAARRKILDHRRDKKRLEERLDEYETVNMRLRGIEDDPVAALELKELFELIGWTLNEMSRERRTVVLLRRMDGLSHKAIAAQCGIELDTVNKHLIRAGHQLEAALIDYRE